MYDFICELSSGSRGMLVDRVSVVLEEVWLNGYVQT